MPRLFVRQIAIFGLHPFIGGFDIGVALWRAASGVALVLYPLAVTGLYADGVAFGLHFGGQAEPFDIHHLTDIFGEQASIAGCNITAH